MHVFSSLECITLQLIFVVIVSKLLGTYSVCAHKCEHETTHSIDQISNVLMIAFLLQYIASLEMATSSILTQPTSGK